MQKNEILIKLAKSLLTICLPCRQQAGIIPCKKCMTDLAQRDLKNELIKEDFADFKDFFGLAEKKQIEPIPDKLKQSGLI